MNEEAEKNVRIKQAKNISRILAQFVRTQIDSKVFSAWVCMVFFYVIYAKQFSPHRER